MHRYLRLLIVRTLVGSGDSLSHSLHALRTMAPTANANITSSGLTYSAQVDSNLAEHPLILDSSSRRTVGCSYAILTEASLSSDHAQWPASHGYPTLTRGKGISEALHPQHCSC